MNNQDKLREKMGKMKKEVQEEKALAEVKASKEALAFLKNRAEQNRGVDAYEGGGLPMLSLIQNDEFSAEIDGGVDPIPGAYYYKPTQAQIENPIVNIVYVKECRLDSEYKGKITKNKHHYLLAGILEESNEPFIMYIKGLSYGEIAIEKTSLMTQTRPWRKHPTSPVPLYAFKIKLDSVKKDSKWGKKRVTIYRMLVSNDLPMIEGDLGRLEMLDKAVDSGKEWIEGIIERNGQGQYEDDSTQLERDAEEALVDSEEPR